MDNQPANLAPTTIKPPKKRNRIKTVGVTLLVVLILGGAGYSAYAWNSNKSLSADITDKTSKIAVLNDRINLLNAKLTNNGGNSSELSTKSGENTVFIPELGISIVVPDSIADVTYSYDLNIGEGGSRVEAVSFSTKSITDKYAGKGDCSSRNAPLGMISKYKGTAPKVQNRVVKQLSGFYVEFNSPQSVCSDGMQTGEDLGAMNALSGSVSTIKELN